MDIRNYFKPINSKKNGKTSSSSKETKKLIIIDSDEEELPAVSKRNRVLDSDSDDDIFVIKNKKKTKKDEKPKPKTLPKPESPKLKPTAATDFFGKTPIARRESEHVSSKKRKSDDFHESQSDDAFERTLQQLDKEKQQVSKKPRIERKSSSHNEEKPKPNEYSPPNKTSLKLGLCSKLSAKLKQFECNTDKYGDEETAQRNSNREEKLHTLENKHIEKDVKTGTECKEIGRTEDKAVKKEEKFVKKERQIEEENIMKPEEKIFKKERQNKEENLIKPEEKTFKRDKITPKKENKVSPKNHKPNIIIEKKQKEEKKVTPKKTEDDRESTEADSTPQDEKKKHARASYMKFLQRPGPANPGSKLLPEGAPECLQGLVFVLSGVFDSLDREEAIDLIKKYGGKVTTSLSRNTTYLVLGSEAGASKLKKIDEDGLLELIRTRPGKEQKQEVTKGKTTNKLKAFAREIKEELPGKSTSVKDSPVPSSNITKTPSPKKSFSQSQSSQETGSPSSTSSTPKTQPISSQDLLGRQHETLMWVDKYKPSTVKNIIGQQGDRSNVRKLLAWLKNWQKVQFSPWAKDDNGAFFKAALLSGPPGVGKTTTAHLVCKELGFDFVELNASDARSKRTLDEVVSGLLSNKSLAGFVKSNGIRNPSSNHALVMDEVDGMSGNEDRGGVQELIALIKKSQVPIIAMCNDRNHPKIRSLANHCFDLRFYKPRIEQIRGPMMSVCFREGIKIKPDALDQIIVGTNQDVRQILHHLSMWSANQRNLEVDDMKREAQRAKKNLKMGPWDVCKAVFSESEHKNMSIHDKSGLFFHDYNIGPLFVQENYPKVVPHVAKGNRNITLEQLAKTASSLADGDLVEKAIRSNNAWSLLPTQAMFSSVIPGEYMCGHLASQIEFPRWLGNHSRRNKFDRFMQELQKHMRLKISGSKLDVGLDYCGSLRSAITNPLVQHGGEGVSDAVRAMTSYDLLREDLDALLELSQWPGMTDPMSKVESKVKAAFTRTYNKESHLTPFAAPSITKKKKGTKVGGEDMYGDEEEEEEDEEEEDISSSAMIKVNKGIKKGGEAGTSKGKSRGGDNGKRGGGKGKGKK
ncbi:Replication factor C subunit 1-like [Homarus americanus]|uniref:Replication factor C subunit 1 n=1 Tax=Homarus americanus TaxID=6706 RepID=A0A8J5JDH4_HOMAM|nr:Replication factor C subunit 1-like [Homarus americanus]